MTTTASTKDKLDRLLSLPAGATHVANYKTENFVDVVMGATGGKGVDIVVDTVGQSHFTRNVDALAMDGRLILLSMISGSSFITLLLRDLPLVDTIYSLGLILGPMVSDLSLRPILTKRLRIQGSTLRSQSKDYKADLVKRSAPPG